MRFFTNPYVGPDGEVSNSIALPSSTSCAEEALEMIKLCLSQACNDVSIDDGGLYVGGVGVVWSALRVLSQIKTGSDALLFQTRSFIEKLVNKAALDEPRSSEGRLSFLLGMPGVWLTAVFFYQHTAQIVERDRFIGLYAQLALHFAALHPNGNSAIFRQGSDELFIGRAGYLCGLFEIRRSTAEAVVSEETVFAICDAIIESGRSYAQKHRSRCPLMFAYHGTEYLGAAHGLAGILFALMLSQHYMRARTSATHLVREAIDYLISVTPADTGNLPAATDELPPHHRTPETQELVHWCHGAAGAVYVYARAYVLWNDEVYLRAAKRCADVVWTRGLLKKGPGICHGVAGSGYTQLLLYRLTGEERYLGRAGALAVFMQEEDFRRHARRPDNPLSLFEGRAGTAAFLADLANPQQAAFPFMDVFDA